MLEALFEIVREYSPFIAALLMAGIGGATAERLRADQARRRWRAHKHQRWNNTWGKTSRLTPLQSAPDAVPAKTIDAADQLRIVMEADFASQSLLNRSEARVFKELDQMVLSRNPLWQVMAQVSLGEILRTKNRTAYGCVNSKRVDLLLVDEHCRPRHVVEYQGAGHHQSSAAARDAVKKEALRRAGISYHEVVAGQTTPSELRRLVERLVEKPPTLQPGASEGSLASPRLDVPDRLAVGTTGVTATGTAVGRHLSIRKID